MFDNKFRSWDLKSVYGFALAYANIVKSCGFILNITEEIIIFIYLEQAWLIRTIYIHCATKHPYIDRFNIACLKNILGCSLITQIIFRWRINGTIKLRAKI